MTTLTPQLTSRVDDVDVIGATAVAKKPHAALTKRLIGGAALAMALKIAGAGSTLLLQLFLARSLGARQFGEYVFILAWLQGLTLLAKCGWDSASARFVAEYAIKQEFSLLRGFRWQRDCMLLAMGISLASAAAVIIYVFVPDTSPTLVGSFWIALPLVPLLALADVAATDLRARQRIAWADVPLQVLCPMLILALAALLFTYGASAPATTTAMSLLAISSALVTALLLWRARQEFTSLVPTGTKMTFAMSTWRSTTWPLFWIAGCNAVLLQADVLLVGLFVDAESAGIYSAAARIAGVVALGLAAVNAVGAPLVAEQFALGNRVGLQHTARLMAWGAILITVPVAILVVAGGPWLLQLFGSQFTAGYTVLVVLMAGQVVNGLAGSVGQLLAMTNRQATSARILGCFAVLQLVLCLLLIPLLGMLGAALVTTAVRIGWNVALGVVVASDLGINPTVFGSWPVTNDRVRGGKA